ncbi:hypothetical protein L195_g058489, partial [Trifolium pratense]
MSVGCSNDITPHKEWLTNFNASKKTSIRLADNSKLAAQGQLVQKGFSVNMEDNALKLFDKMKSLVLMRNLSKNRTYKCNTATDAMMCLATRTSEDVEALWHK